MIRRALCLVLACTACVRYQPRPVDPTAHPATVVRRNLEDPILVGAVTGRAGRPEAGRWTDRQLALAALYLRSDLRRLRAEWRVARAAVRAAGERPGVGVEGELERRVGGRDEGSPWVVGLTGLFAIELGGKRGARLQSARAGVVVAESRLMGSAHAAVVETRLAAAALAHALEEAEDAGAEVRLLETVHELERARFAEAALGASELARTGREVQSARLARAGAAHAVLAARALLAGSIAVPTYALDSLVPAITTTHGCTGVGAAPDGSLAAAAMARRHEVALALGEYALAESRLRLQVARQFPDLELGPGFVWDQGVNRWALAFAIPALLGSRNRGAIAEAESRRDVAGLRVAEVQDSVLADVELAAQRCRGAGLELAAADSVVAAAERLERREREAYQRGETSRLDPARAELQLLQATRARRAAARRLALASMQLERAGGGPPSADVQWPDPRQDLDRETPRP